MVGSFWYEKIEIPSQCPENIIKSTMSIPRSISIQRAITQITEKQNFTIEIPIDNILLLIKPEVIKIFHPNLIYE